MVRLSTGFSDFLASRSKELLAVAPGILTARRFSEPRGEHLATRRAAGLFDLSFMGCAEITGAHSLAFLNSLQTRALDALPAGRIAYTLLLRDDGSVLNDATVWHLGRDRYWLFIGRPGDVELIARWSADFDVIVGDVSGGHVVFAVQGAASWRILERFFAGQRLPALPYYSFAPLSFAGGDCLLARIGYSGETGYELVAPAAAGAALWQALLAAGAGDGLIECGFDAMDALRIEAGHLLFSHELATGVTPFELGLGRLVDFYRIPFRGALALRAQRWKLPPRRLVGLLPAGEAPLQLDVPAHILPGGAALTSARWSPIYDRWLGMGYVNGLNRYAGTSVTLGCGTRARVARLPFYDPARHLPRRTLMP